MATVYLAEDLRHHRKVAIKVLRSELAATLGAKRFQQEIEIAAGLQHPHILGVHDSGEADGFLFYVMPYVEGESLRQRLDRGGRMSVPEVIRLLLEVADALAQAHARGVVHRDIKPENIMLSGRHALVMDFGVAKAVSDASERRVATTVGVALGTPSYMAPEQVTADPKLDHRADIYALGVLGYELLSGRLPFFEGTPQQILAAHLTQNPEPVTLFRPDIPPALANVVMRALAKLPEDRWQNAGEVIAQLEPILSTGSAVAMPTLAQTYSIAQSASGKRWQMVLAGSLAGIAIIAALIFWNRRSVPDPNAAPPAIASTTVPAVANVPVIAQDPSIAVLPFVNMSSDKEQEFFSDGISEELLNLLAKVPNLRVIARTSSFSFKGKDVAIPEIARALNVSSILEGSVRKSGNQLRITVQLIRAADGSQLWSETYDREMTDIFKTQDEIAAAVVDKLKITLLGDAPRTHVVGSKAYSLLLQARVVSFQNSPQAHEKAIGLFKQALALNPDYTEAWVGLANIYCLQMGFGTKPADQVIPLAREALEEALAVEPDNAQAHALQGWVAIGEGDLQRAARNIERAVALDPTNSQVLDIAAFLARILGRLELAIDLGEHVRERDPVNPDNLYDLALAYFFDGQLDKAITQLRSILNVSPDYLGVHAVLGQVLLRKGDASAALAELRLEPKSMGSQSTLAMVYYTLGRKAEADAALASLMAEADESALSVAFLLAHRGDVDGAFKWIEKSAQRPNARFFGIAASPALARLHDDPRWLPFLRRFGQAPEQLAKIEFNATLH